MTFAYVVCNSLRIQLNVPMAIHSKTLLRETGTLQVAKWGTAAPFDPFRAQDITHERIRTN